MCLKKKRKKQYHREKKCSAKKKNVDFLKRFFPDKLYLIKKKGALP